MELWKKYEVTHERIYGIIKEKVNKRLKKEVLPVHCPYVRVTLLTDDICEAKAIGEDFSIWSFKWKFYKVDNWLEDEDISFEEIFESCLVEIKNHPVEKIPIETDEELKGLSGDKLHIAIMKKFFGFDLFDKNDK